MDFKNIISSEYDRDPAFVRLIKVMLALSALSMLIIAAALAILNKNFLSVIAVLFLAVLSGISLFFAYREILLPGKAVFPLIILFAVTFLAINANGMHDSAIVGFTMVIIFASLFSGQKAIPLATLFTLFGIWTVAYADMTGINKSLIAYKTGWDDVTVISMIQIIAAVSLNGLLSRLKSAIEITRRNERELIESNRELNDIRASLEERVIERTRAADFARQEAEAQAWATRGHAQLSEQMRGDLDLPTLANNITSHLSRYIGAQTGALFLASGDVLKLTGRYAYVERAGQKSEFRFGESLIGEAAKSKRIILVDDIPADAPLVSSALGESIPRQILIAPFESNGQVLGVIELATLTQFTADHQDFLKRVSESVAIALRTVQTRLQMSDLLMRSQQQAEELQAQEEELRASNEELQAQADSIRGAMRER